MDSTLAHKHIVLLGIGHTNAHIVRKWLMSPIPGADLTCVTNHYVATYSGMLPAMLAGQIDSQAMEIDLVKLCSIASARLIKSDVVGLDLAKRKVLFTTRPPIDFDVLSIGIGSVPEASHIEISSKNALKIKPMQSFVARLLQAIDRLPSSRNELRIAIIGGGAAGVEIAFCLPNLVRKHSKQTVKVEIVTRTSIMTDANARLAKLTQSQLHQKGIEITRGSVVSVDDQEIRLSDGRTKAADIVVVATGATAPTLLSDLGLPTDPRGFLRTTSTLQTLADPSVFAVGDSGSIESCPTAKAGVYAVRQGPVLWENIQRYLDNKPLRQFSPQRAFLRLLNTGDGRAIGSWHRLAFSGHWVKRLKDWIDESFMEKYRPSPMQDSDPMQCKGCGCKLPAAPLTEALQEDGETFVAEDAASISADGKLVASTDFFSCPFDDPYVSGRIAAIHSASDIVASGACVTNAIANVVVPEGAARSQQAWLRQFMAGAKLEFSKMSATVVGGHTIVGPRAEAGFTVIGETHDMGCNKNSLKAGDSLLLTKPLGTGVLMAAHMRGLCSAAAFDSLMQSMLTSQHEYVELIRKYAVQAVTDITGFGLVGHLLEMLDASRRTASIQLTRIPILSGAEELSRSGVQSSLLPDNLASAARAHAEEGVVSDSRFNLLFDPQTCGGLLISLPTPELELFSNAARAAGLSPPTAIGSISDADHSSKPLSIKQ